MFGRYEVVRRIGRGGMGVVYAAVHRDLKRDVALKLLSPDLALADHHRRRFSREAEILARLESTHIITVYDAGAQDGWLYIATQLVVEGDLSALLETVGPLSIPLALELIAQTAEGLADAHDSGVLHRDIKPSNVLVRRDRHGRPHALLCDLGISTLLDADHTKTGGVIGTYGYLAPERHEGVEASVASDVYALGCLLWALLTGSPPYEGTDMEVALGHLRAPIRQLEGDSSLVEQTNVVLARSMAKRPEHRFQTAGELRQAVLAIVESMDRPAADAGPGRGQGSGLGSGSTATGHGAARARSAALRELVVVAGLGVLALLVLVLVLGRLNGS